MKIHSTLIIIFLSSFILFNCSKKEDPTPAPNTTTNNGSGNGSTGTTPKDSTVAPKDTTVKTMGGTGTFQVDGTEYTPTKIVSGFVVRGNPFAVTFENPNYQISIAVGNVEYGDDKISTIAITVSEFKNKVLTTIYQSTNDKVILKGKTLIFSNIAVPYKYGDENKTKVTISGNITFE